MRKLFFLAAMTYFVINLFSVTALCQEQVYDPANLADYDIFVRFESTTNGEDLIHFIYESGEQLVNVVYAEDLDVEKISVGIKAMIEIGGKPSGETTLWQDLTPRSILEELRNSIKIKFLSKDEKLIAEVDKKNGIVLCTNTDLFNMKVLIYFGQYLVGEIAPTNTKGD